MAYRFGGQESIGHTPKYLLMGQEIFSLLGFLNLFPQDDELDCQNSLVMQKETPLSRAQVLVRRKPLSSKAAETVFTPEYSQSHLRRRTTQPYPLTSYLRMDFFNVFQSLDMSFLKLEVFERY